MIKTFDIQIDCPNCAVKCQEAVKKLEGVKDCSINFMTQKMTVDSDRLDQLLKLIIKTIRRIEPDFEIDD